MARAQGVKFVVCVTENLLEVTVKYIVFFYLGCVGVYIASPPPVPAEPAVQERLVQALYKEALYRVHDCRIDAVLTNCGGCHL